jgi:hypothetical protein
LTVAACFDDGNDDGERRATKESSSGTSRRRAGRAGRIWKKIARRSLLRRRQTLFPQGRQLTLDDADEQERRQRARREYE